MSLLESLHSLTVAPIFGDALQGAPHRFDFSSANPRIMQFDPSDYDAFQASIDEDLREHGATWGIGGYLQERATLLRHYPQMIQEGRVYHLGLDVSSPPDTPVFAPIDGTVIEASKEDGVGNYGGFEKNKDELRKVERILITACGTANVAGRVGEYMFEEYAGIPTEADIASEFRYRKPVFTDNNLLLAVSQSGETADTMACVKEAKEKGVMTMGIVNVVGSSIARETGFGIYNHAGPEISVASTKAFASQVTTLALLTIFLGRQREMSLITGQRIAEALKELPALVHRALLNEPMIIEIAKKYKDMKSLLTMGRKYNAPIATEAAIKFKEVCYIPTIDLPAGEMKHGTIALIDKDFPTLIIAPEDSVYEKTKSNLEEIRARGGKIIAITTEGNEELKAFTPDVMYIPKTLEMLTPILSVIPIYLLAYHIARLRGNDIDKPRNLAKSVTVE
jgi:glucosamine--fructose-6-phosphate aminotransferase (isomerizing)